LKILQHGIEVATALGGGAVVSLGSTALASSSKRLRAEVAAISLLSPPRKTVTAMVDCAVNQQKAESLIEPAGVHRTH
jgi:hypothetical protein